MSKEEELQLFTSIGSEPIYRNNLILIPKENLKATIIGLLRKDIKVLGFDAFKIDANSTRPYLEYSQDYSKAIINNEDSCEIKEIDISEEITHFEIVIDK